MGCVLDLTLLICLSVAVTAQVNNGMYNNNMNNNGMYNNEMYNNLNSNNVNGLNNVNNVNNLNSNNVNSLNNMNSNNVNSLNNLNNANSLNNLNNANSLNNLNGNNVNNFQSGSQNTQSADIDHGPAKFNFSYEVKQPMYGNFYGHEANRDGEREEGRYYVLLPDRRLMTVRYVADSAGYRPTITYSTIDGMSMFQNFLFAPEAKGSPGSGNFGIKMSALTTARPTLPPLIAALSTPASIPAAAPNRNSFNLPQVTTSNTNHFLQFTATTARPRVTTTRPRLTSERPISTPLRGIVTTPLPRTTTSRPRATIGSFVAIASTLRPVTVAPPVTSLSSRSTTPRGGRPFLFPKPDQNSSRGNGNLARGQNNNNNRINQAISPPSFSYLPPPSPDRGGRNTGSRNSNSGNAATNNVANNIGNANKINAFSGGNNMINGNMAKPASTGTTNGGRQGGNGNTGQINFPQNDRTNTAQNSNGNGNNRNEVTGTTSNNRPNGVTDGYLPPKPGNEISQSNSEKKPTGNNSMFNNGFSFFEFNKLNTVPSATTQRSRTQSSTNQILQTTTQTSRAPTAMTINLAINRLTTPRSTFNFPTTQLPIDRLLTQQTTTIRPMVTRTTTRTPTTNRPSVTQPQRNIPAVTTTQSPRTITQSPRTITQSPRLPAPSTQAPSIATTEHEYDKEAGPAYIPVPGLTALIVDAPLPSGNSRQPRFQTPLRSPSSPSTIPTTAIPPTTLRPSSLPPRAKQLSPFFEFFKIQS